MFFARPKSALALILTGLSALTVWQALPHARAAAKIQGYHMLMNQPHTGVWEIYLSADGFAAANPQLGCTVVSKRPQWNVVMFNTKTKVYYLSALTDWKGAITKMSGGRESQIFKNAKSQYVNKPPKKGKTERDKNLNMNLTQYITDNLTSTGLRKMEIWTAPDINVPPEIKQIFSKVYGVGVSTVGGLPLKVSYIDENGKRTPVIVPKELKVSAFPGTKFNYPASYKRVDSELAVLMDEKGREAMASIMDDLGEPGGEEDLDTVLGGEGKQAKVAYKSSKYDTGYEKNKDDLFADTDTGPEATASSGETIDSLPGGDEGATPTKAGEGDFFQAIGDWFKGFLDWITGFGKEPAKK